MYSSLFNKCLIVKEFAEQCEILETGPGEELDPSQAYYGVGGD